MTAQIRMNAIMRSRKGKIFGIMRMKVGMMRIREAVAIAEPRSVSFRAWCPRPANSSSCPGRVPNPVSSSGAPRKMAGMKSRKVWVIAIAVMKIIRVIGSSCEMIVREKRKMATRLMWMPGIRPVNVPAMIPRIRGIIRLIMFCYFVYDYLFLVFVGVSSALE